MKRSLGVYIRKGRQQRHVRTKTFADNFDDYGKCIFSLINRTAKFIRKKIACEFGCFCFLRSCKNSRAPPLSVLNIQKISIRGNKKCVQKNFFNFFSFSSCQNGDFCTTYMKGKTEHHFRKCGRR